MSLTDVSSMDAARVRVRPVAEADLPDLFAINGDAEVTRFLPYATWQSLDDAVAWLRRMQGLQDAGTARQLVVERRDDGRVIGTVLLFRFEAPSARVELGYVLGRAFWGQGYMGEALRVVCDRAFGELALRRIEAEVSPGNAASKRLLQRLGFVLEGTLRKRWMAKGVAYDTDIYGLLADDWSSLKR